VVETPRGMSISSISRRCWDFLNVETVDGEPQADLDAGPFAVANSIERSLEGARTASKTVVDFLHAVQADAT